MTIYYAGIGSRETPEHALVYFTHLAEYFDKTCGFVLRSGGANGADSAFEHGAPAHARQIFLPWPRFNGNASPLHSPPPEAFDIASQFHPGWKYLKPAARSLMARNVQQVLGPDCRTQPSRFVACWTKDGKGEGGTGQAIRIAEAYGIPVFDFGRGMMETHIALIGGVNEVLR